MMNSLYALSVLTVQFIRKSISIHFYFCEK